MKKAAFLFFLLLAVWCVPHSILAETEEKTGSVGIVVNYTQESLQQYRTDNPDSGSGIYVFVQNIENNKTYRYPLSEANQYEGRFQIPYGNYKIIRDPSSSGGCQALCSDVFAVSENTPDVSIVCTLEIENSSDEKEKNSLETASPENSAEGSGEELSEESGRKLTGQTVFSIIILIFVFGSCLYRRFFKSRR